ncbi:MAG: PA2169 family four-helix-bundle protein [Phycisphaerales bacterium]|nr:PA2169 family four-helix-bundle protein [Phycisphaerales bacterium]
MTTATLMNEQAVSCLQDLIRVNIDSAEGFQAAAELVEDDAIGAFFIRCSHERDGYVEELSTLVEVNLVEPVASGSMTGQMHRWWMELRGNIQRGDEHAMLAEAERGEDVICVHYRTTLDQVTGSPAHEMIERQYREVRACHDRIRELRDRSR